MLFTSYTPVHANEVHTDYDENQTESVDVNLTEEDLSMIAEAEKRMQEEGVSAASNGPSQVARSDDPTTEQQVSSSTILTQLPQSNAFSGALNYSSPQALNYYSYVMNSPIVYNDPTGEETNVYIKEGDWDHGIDSYFGHIIVEIHRDGQSTFYSWSPAIDSNHSDLTISTDSEYINEYRDSNDEFTMFNFDTSVDQENSINQYYADLYDSNFQSDSDTTYNPFSFNCADVAVESLRAGDVLTEGFKMSGIATPNELKGRLNWKHNNQNTRFKLLNSDLDYIMDIRTKKEL